MTFSIGCTLCAPTVDSSRSYAEVAPTPVTVGDALAEVDGNPPCAAKGLLSAPRKEVRCPPESYCESYEGVEYRSLRVTDLSGLWCSYRRSSAIDLRRVVVFHEGSFPILVVLVRLGPRRAFAPAVRSSRRRSSSMPAGRRAHRTSGT